MPSFVPKKRVTDPFDDDARARLVGAHHRQLNYGTPDFGDGDSLSLSYLVHGFLEEETNCSGDDSVANELDWDRVDSVDDCVDSVHDSLRVALANNMDPYRNTLLPHVSEAAEKFAFLRERNVSAFRRSVVAFLRERGHDAAVCATVWDSSSGVAAGSHEFVDVVQSGASTRRYIVDLDFRTQFEIARATQRFWAVLSSVPREFVGEAEELKRAVSIVCDAVRKCFSDRGLSVPPWRKNRFMQNKWFGPGRRTANPVLKAVTAVNSVNCRLVGFNDARRGSGVVVRTRG
ncbi:uncharacterized protein LOC113849424 [Abrus precatorius]|uniref:Uncharacterized protein LOC113849424 n=1 Tax=Abrus precatorius TaxID=3816 RepID=A0A8B8JUM8_ABRPR|nr:uncharacterized protein LOC113849424 [Abrus precatorius]